jgi:hypothetical protein
MKSRQLGRILSLTFLAGLLSTQAQTPPPREDSPIRITKIELQKAALPSSSLQWLKIVATFTTSERWMDGVLFSARAILAEGDQFRAVSGMVRYMNIPEGTHNAFFYLSPRAAQRFGAPIAIEVGAFYNDLEVAQMLWTNPSGPAREELPQWESINNYPNVLVPINRTPWIMVDYDKAPDLGGN